MKKFIRTLLSILFLLFCIQVKAVDVKKGTAYIFADNVLFRNAPTQQGKILSKFSIATKVEIIEKASALTTVNGAENYWYKIKNNNTEGYVWGGLLADMFCCADLDDDGIQEVFMIMNNSKGLYDVGFNNTSYLWFRVARANKLIFEYKRFDIYKYNLSSIAFEKMNQFKDPLSVIRFKYGFMGDVGGNGEQFFSFKNNYLDSLFTVVYEQGEGGFVCYGTLAFPCETNGQENALTVTTKCADVVMCDDIKGPPCKWEYNTTVYSWDGKRFAEKK